MLAGHLNLYYYKKIELLNALCTVLCVPHSFHFLSFPFFSFSFTMSSFLSFLHSLLENGTIPMKSYGVMINYANPNNEKFSYGYKIAVNSTNVYNTLFDGVKDDIVEENDYVEFRGLNIKFTIKRIDSQWKIDTFSTWPDYFTD